MKTKIYFPAKSILFIIRKLKYLFILLLLVFALHNNANAQNCSVNANIDFTLCANEPLLLVGQKAGLFYGSGTTTWSQISGPTLNILSPNALTTAVTGHVGNTVYKFRITTKCLDGTLTYDDVTYTVKPITQSNAGPDQTICPGSPAGLMAGNSVGVNETGSWLVTGTNNGVTVSNSLSPTSAYNLDAAKSGITKMVWTINNTNGCLSRDTMTITNRGGVNPVNAGTDKILTNCYSSSQTTSMTASFGGSGIDGQIGTWTLLTGPSIPTISNSNNGTTNASSLIEGTYKLLWSVSGSCANGADTVQIIVPPATSSVTSVSINSVPAFCDGKTSTVLTATTPLYTNETGLWTKNSGPVGVVIENPTNPITNITGLNGSSSYGFKYTITNSLTGCSSSNTTTLSYSLPASIDISVDQTILPCGQTFAVIPYTTSGGGTVQWSIISGPKTPTYNTIPTNYANASGSPLTINGLTVSGTYVIRLKKSSGTGPSCNTVFDDVTVVVSANPTGSNSGTKQILACNVTQTALAGNLPYVGLGNWTQVSGPNTATIDSVNKFDSPIKNMISGTYKFRWLIAGGPYCSTQQSDVTIVVVSANPSQANAGPDVTSCANTPLYLNGNNPLLNETGTWTVIPSTGISFSDVNSPNSVVTGLTANTTYQFIWKMQNACSFNTDTMIVTTNNITGPIQANAGPDQCKTSGTTSTTLAGNNPGTSSGTWTKISGGSATITNPNLYNTTVTGLSDGTYRFEWSIISNGACNPTRDTVIITISAPATTANAGSDQQICGNSANLSGNIPSIGTGTWSQLSGNGGATINDSSINNANISGLTNGVYNFLWTVSNNACPANSDTVKIYVTNPPTIPNAGSDFSVCGFDTTSLNANVINVGTGSWSFVSGPNSPVFVNASNPKTKVTGLITGTYTFKWSSYSGPFCPTNSDNVSVTVVLPANAGSDQSYCDATNTVNLIGTNASTGTWTQVNVLNPATITTTSSNSATASNLTTGSYTFRYSINALGCSSTDDMIVNLYAPPTIANAGSDISYCNEDTVQLAGNTPLFGTATWTKLSGPSGGSFKPNANTPNAIFTASTAGTYVFVYTISNNTCSNADQVIVRNYALPTNANAGFDQNSICTNSTLMSANLPSNGLGNWTLINGPNTPNIVSPILPNTNINNLIPGEYNFEWSISSGICSIKKDTIKLIVNQPPTTANAGIDQVLCNTPSLNLQGNTPTIGTGNWTQFSGPNTAVFSDETNPNTLVSNLVNGTYIFNWTTSFSPCSSTDQVIITNYQNPTIANAGSDINNCLFTPLALNANNPSLGIGQWSQLSGPVTTNILSPNSPNSYILGTVPGNYSFIWTINNGICNSSKDTVDVVVSDIPTMAVAGSDQSLCNVTTINLAGNSPSQGIGTWTQNSGPNINITNINSPTTSVTNVVPGTYNFIWQTSNNFCTSTDNVNFTVYGQPISNAGSNQEYCNSNTFTMSANAPVYGTGNWTKISGPNTPTITTASSPTTTITGATTGTYVFRWTVSNGNCTPVTSDVTITNYALPTIANAGNNQSICASSATMSANTASVGTGLWSQESGPNTATITNSGLKNTTITGLIQGTYIFKWTISNGNCSASTSLVTINVSANSTIANAGTAQTLCNVTSVSLSGNNPVIGNGSWSMVSGPNSPSFTNAGLFNTDVNNLTNGTYIFKWTISNGVCTASESQVTITNNQLPTTANAGATQNLCNITTTNLNANIPTVGTGEWSLISGPNTPTITNSALNNTSVSNMITGTYVFRWTISNANCTPSTADVTINNYELPTLADAGTAQTLCNATSVSLSGNNPATGNGSWSLVSGPNSPLFTNAGLFNTNVTNLINGTYIFKWTISNGVCTASESQVTITNNQLPTTANAGATQNLCNVTTTNLNGNIPTVGTGEWSLISGPNTPTITNSALNNTSVSNMITGTYVFRWTISNANCTPSTADVTINNIELPTVADAGGNQSFCKSQTSTILAANTAIIGNGSWSQVSGPTTASFGSTSNPNTGVSNLVFGSYIFKWTISNGSCTPSTSEVTVQLINCIPVAINDTNSTPENTAVSGNILPNDSDPDGDALVVTSFIVGGVTYAVGTTVNINGIGNIIINSDGSYTFTPATNWSGVVPNIPYTISDGFGGTATADLIITVTPVPHYIDLSVTKELTDPNPLFNDTIHKNDTVTFTIILKNNSSVFNATNIVVLDTLPMGMNYVSSATSNGNYDHVSGLWTLANLNALDFATLNISVKVDTSAENNVYIISHNNPDSNLYNNKDFASVSVSNTSSGNDGGLESNGNLASKVGLRNFLRHKDRNEIYNHPEKLELFSPASLVAVKSKSAQTTDLINLIPTSTANDLPAMISTPIDLIGISNAIEVVAVDYFNQSDRKAAILGIASNVGTVYEHTKMVCDRLDGGFLNNISYDTINGYPFLLASITQDNNNTDYAISFIAYKSGNTYYIDSKWDLEDYNPSGNHAVLNFQVWSINEKQTKYLVSKVLEKISFLGYNIVYKNNTYPKFPEVYVKNGTYKDGNLELNLVNTDGASSITMNGNKAIVEDGLRFPFNYASPISTARNSSISVPTGNIFDIGFSLGNNTSQANDVLYFADGPWGREFDQTGATVNDFSISSQFNPALSGAFNLGRNANLEGTVKTYASLYRVLRVGNKAINLTNYDKLEFTALGSGSFDVVISKAGIAAWNDQYKTTVNLDYNTANNFKIPISQFANAQGQHNLDLNDAVSVVFVKKGNNSTYQNFAINVSDMRFINNFSGIDPKATASNQIDVYPNPFSSNSTITFSLKKTENVKVGLYDLQGKLIRLIANKQFGMGINNININADNLASGIYMIKVETNSFNSYEKIIISK